MQVPSHRLTQAFILTHLTILFHFMFPEAGAFMKLKYSYKGLFSLNDSLFILTWPGLAPGVLF